MGVQISAVKFSPSINYYVSELFHLANLRERSSLVLQRESIRIYLLITLKTIDCIPSTYGYNAFYFDGVVLKIF